MTRCIRSDTHATLMKPGTLNRVVIIASVVVLLGLAGLYTCDTLLTNRTVARFIAYVPGTPFVAVSAAHGAPDRIDEVSKSWQWGRRMRRIPDNVKRVAVYNRAIAPQVVAYLLDENDLIVEIDRFAGY